jgi:hypothetical protein
VRQHVKRRELSGDERLYARAEATIAARLRDAAA